MNVCWKSVRVRGIKPRSWQTWEYGYSPLRSSRNWPQRARQTFDRLDIPHITSRAGDGYQGWPEEAPFDAIILTAAPEHIPQPLLDQLAPGGRMILPLGKTLQKLIIFTNTPAGIQRKELLPVAFVPMTGEAQTRSSSQ